MITRFNCTLMQRWVDRPRQLDADVHVASGALQRMG